MLSNNGCIAHEIMFREWIFDGWDCRRLDSKDAIWKMLDGKRFNYPWKIPTLSSWDSRWDDSLETFFRRIKTLMATSSSDTVRNGVWVDFIIDRRVLINSRILSPAWRKWVTYKKSRIAPYRSNCTSRSYKGPFFQRRLCFCWFCYHVLESCHSSWSDEYFPWIWQCEMCIMF